MDIYHRSLALNQDFDLLALQQKDNTRYPFLLQSVVQGATARFDILFALPQQTLVSDASQDFLSSLDDEWRLKRHKAPTDNMGLPFTGGWFVFLSYELAAQIEPSLKLPVMPNVPIAFATEIPAAIIVDYQKETITCVAQNTSELDGLLDDVNAYQTLPKSEIIQPEVINEADSVEFLTAVAQIKEYILAGDVFQVNLSRAWQATLPKHTQAWQLYQRLKQANPAPFSGIAHYQDMAIISSSPERLVKSQQGIVEVRPIAGTHPRSVGQQDIALSQALLAHPKERAEHVMLIDLERNDLGRVCLPGSIQVDELMALESYQHVHHIVSNVRGRLRSDISPAQVLRAIFPGGTITGCPKVRCMQIIAELEQAGRGPYTGAMGYLNYNGDMDMNILIRSFLLQQQQLTFRAGSGIVADSVPERELAETRAKAKGLLHALC